MYQSIQHFTKIQRSKIFINDEKQTVVCIIDTALGTFEGKSKCSPQDTFDIAVGKKIAYNRALRQANAFAKVYIRETILKPALKVVSDLEDRQAKSALVIKTELDKLN